MRFFDFGSLLTTLITFSLIRATKDLNLKHFLQRQAQKAFGHWQRLQCIMTNTTFFKTLTCFMSFAVRVLQKYKTIP